MDELRGRELFPPGRPADRQRPLASHRAITRLGRKGWVACLRHKPPRKPSFRKTSFVKPETQRNLADCKPTQQPSRPFRPTSTCHGGPGQLYSSVAPAQSIAVAHRKPRPGAFHCTAADFTGPPHRSPKTAALPSGPLRAAFTLRQEPANDGFVPRPPVRYRNGSEPVPAFVVASCPAPPVSTQTSPPLPCSGPRWTSIHSYLRATPRLGF